VHSKIAAEQQVLRYSQEASLPITVLRPGTIYGPGGKVFFPRIGYAVKNRLICIIGHGNHFLPLAYVSNVADAIYLAGTRAEAVGHIYNIVDDDLITQREYVSELLRRGGGKGVALRVPLSCIYMLAYAIEAQAALRKTDTSPFLSRYRLVSGAKAPRYDTSRAKHQLQWKPRVSLEEGLKQTFNWYTTQTKHL
jgi:nucleoside-diphosphate-sugar epimerase